MATTKVTRRGAPGRATHQRPVLQFRVHEDVYAKLKASAAARKLTISEEASRRVEQSLGQGGLLAALLEAAYGPALASAFVKSHEHHLLVMRREDKEALLALAAKSIDEIPEAKR